MLAAIVFVAWTDTLRLKRVEYVSSIAEASLEDTSFPTSPAAWQPRLIVPGHDNASYEWLDQTRQMFAMKEWRVRHLDYENAPFGREVDAASPYRWWLGAIAWADRAMSGRPIGQSIERAALVADPLLHVLLLAGTAIFVAWRFGAFAAALFAAGTAAIFPFAVGFLPGAPNDPGLGQVLALWSVLLLLAGIGARQPAVADAEKRVRNWFLAAGVVGGLGLWVNLSVQVPVLAGIAVGGLIAAWVARANAAGQPASPVLPWLVWALGGAAAGFAGYLMEYFPGHLGSWELRVVHPLYALAWVGGGVLLARAAVWIQRASSGRISREIGLGVFGLAALAALPFAMWRTHSWGFLAEDLPALHLTRLSGDQAAANSWAWLLREGLSAKVEATLLPLLLVLLAGWLIWRRSTAPVSRVMMAVALGPVLFALGFACRQLSWWSQVDVLLLVLLVAATATCGAAVATRLVRWVCAGVLAVICMMGAVQIFPRVQAGATNVLDDADLFGLVERDLARWLSLQVGPQGAVVLAPHNQAISLYYYGGLRGLATLNRENLDGLGAAIRILSASTPEEAKELVDRRGITHFILPSWDGFLDTYTRMGVGKIEGTFYGRLQGWRQPPWLQPVPYQLPTIPGFEGQSVRIFAVVDDQDDAAALSRIAEYFVEMGQLEEAGQVAQALRRFPADLGALTARAQVDFAKGDQASFDKTMESLKRRLSGGADRGLPWDLRASLAVVLARAKQTDLARVQVQRCMTDVNEARLRSLSTGALFRLQVLGKNFALPITDPHLRALALDLLPPEMRGRVQ